MNDDPVKENVCIERVRRLEDLIKSVDKKIIEVKESISGIHKRLDKMLVDAPTKNSIPLNWIFGMILLATLGLSLAAFFKG